MKLKALVIAVFFIAGIFSGSALADEKGVTSGRGSEPGVSGGGVSEGQRGVPMKDSKSPGAYKKDDDKMMHQSGMHKASYLIGMEVASQDGKDLGSIKDLVIGDNGQVDYIIMSRGGVAGVGGDMVPIPWQAANLQAKDDDKVTAAITEQQLESAPGFDDWAQFSSPENEQKVHSYFGTQPHGKSTQPVSPMK